MTWLFISALFLPLYPFSAIFNALLCRLHSPLASFAFILIWPQIGVAAMQLSSTPIHDAFLPWALGSAGLYALRLLSVRELSRYAGFLASSSLALAWPLALGEMDVTMLSLFAFCFSLPAAILALLSAPLTQRFGTAYSGICTGLGNAMPRLSTVLVIALLAGIVTAPFPTFFALWVLLMKLHWSAALVVLAMWFVWGWSATMLMRGFIFGSSDKTTVTDISRSAVWSFTLVLLVFTSLGFILMRGSV